MAIKIRTKVLYYVDDDRPYLKLRNNISDIAAGPVLISLLVSVYSYIALPGAIPPETLCTTVHCLTDRTYPCPSSLYIASSYQLRRVKFVHCIELGTALCSFV